MATRYCDQGLHAGSDTLMPDTFERGFPVCSELVGGQFFQHLAKAM
jgi:hypothetical protein